MKKIIVSVFLSCSLLAACQTSSGPGEFGANKTTFGTVLGGVGGAVAGQAIGGGTGRIVATAAGALLGAFVGNQVGASLDRADIAYARRAESRVYSAPIGQQIAWNNPQSGNSGQFVATREGIDGGGNYCREYQSTVIVGGKRQNAYGTACRQPDGTWKIIN